MSFTTPNKQLIEPANSSYVGTWDVPLNANFSIIDLSFGGLTTIALTNVNVTLAAAQYQCAFIRLTGALTGACNVVFPLYGSFYFIDNQCTNNLNFNVYLTTNAGQFVCAPPGEVTQIYCDGAAGNIRYVNMGRVGSYMDMATTAIPGWISGCTVPPYINANGTGFSSALYPTLRDFMGSSIPADSRGRARYTLNQGTVRLTSAGAGLDGNTLNAAGGSNGISLTQANIPSYALPVTDPTHSHTVDTANGGYFLTGLPIAASVLQTNGVLAPLNQSYEVNYTTDAAATGITVNSGGGNTVFPNSAPGYVGGVTLIRAG